MDTIKLTLYIFFCTGVVLSINLDIDDAKSFPSSVTSMPIVKIQAARTSAHVRMDTLGMGKRVGVRTSIAHVVV